MKRRSFIFITFGILISGLSYKYLKSPEIVKLDDQDPEIFKRIHRDLIMFYDPKYLDALDYIDSVKKFEILSDKGVIRKNGMIDKKKWIETFERSQLVEFDNELYFFDELLLYNFAVLYLAEYDSASMKTIREILVSNAY